MSGAEKIRCAIGCAGWSLRKEQSELFPGADCHLARYARRLPAVELNSSFYRPHRRSTYQRWASSVADHFRFAVKAPKEITHDRRLASAIVPLELFLEQISGLGDRLGPVLFQFAPRMEFCRTTTAKFLATLRARFDGQVVFEPRHESWFRDDCDELLSRFEVARAAADPPVVPVAGEPGGWPGLVYHRLHGSPHVYESAYGADRLRALAERLCESAACRPTWCVFDNTKYGASTLDAIALVEEHVPRRQASMTLREGVLARGA